jgi:hypothetical protein
MNYMHERENYLRTVGELQALVSASEQQNQTRTKEQQKAYEEAQQKQQAQSAEFIKSEYEKLFSKVQTLSKKENWEAFVAEAHAYGGKYWDLAPEVMNSVPYHGFILMARDAIAFRKALEKKAAANNPPQAVQQQAQTPRVAQRQRMAQTPEGKSQNDALDRLRKYGTINDGAKALEKFVQ